MLLMIISLIKKMGWKEIKFNKIVLARRRGGVKNEYFSWKYNDEFS